MSFRWSEHLHGYALEHRAKQQDYQNGHQLHHAVKDYIERYNYLRTHQSLGDATPAEVYMGDISAPVTFIKRKYQGELISIKMICENLETDQSTEVLEEEKHH